MMPPPCATRHCLQGTKGCEPRRSHSMRATRPTHRSDPRRCRSTRPRHMSSTARTMRPPCSILKPKVSATAVSAIPPPPCWSSGSRRLRVASARCAWDPGILCLEPPASSRPVRDIVQRVLESGSAWVSVAQFEGRDVIRACVTHGETSPDDIEAVAALLEQARTA